ncbi:MAG: NAD-dependent epimerase/dehydratase family protein [Crocinitomicaceae bacterium]|nr:NAD-dependent epimerase/dehydratase family protein [Crocinitomicaceae bacterium]
MIFVTGGTGVLGAQLLYDLTQQSTQIRAIYRSEAKLEQTRKFFKLLNPSSWENQFSQIEWVVGNILDLPLLEEQMTGCSHVYHCAAKVSFHKGDFIHMIQINRYGTANIVNLCLALNIEKLCYVSSTAAIGGDGGSTITEETKWKLSPTTSGYSVSKYSAEKEVWRGIEEGLNAVMVNPCVIIGAGNWNDSSLTLFKTLKKGMKYYPPGSNATVDSRDVSSIMIQLMNSEISSERFLCIGTNHNFKDLITEISGQLNVKSPRKLAKRWMVVLARKLLGFIYLFSSKRPPLTKESVQSVFSHRNYDNSKIREALNFDFHDLKSSVKNTIENKIS